MRLAVAAMTLLVASPPADKAAERHRLERECVAGGGRACTQMGWSLLQGEDPPLGRALAAFRRGCGLGDASGCLEAGRILAKREDSDPAHVLRLFRLGCEHGRSLACQAIVSDVADPASIHRFAATADARDALSHLNARCDAGGGMACAVLGEITGSGVPDLLVADLDQARRLTERACALDWKISCYKAEQLRAEAEQRRAGPPSAERARDRIREGIVRDLLQGSYVKLDSAADEPRPLCVAFGSEQDMEGSDAPTAFLDRFSDVPAVRPASWCREHQDGNIVVIGSVSYDAAPPYADARVWHVLYAWDGAVRPSWNRLVARDGEWTLGSYASRNRPELAVKEDDHAEDRRRILDLVNSFIAAWNRGDPLLDAGGAGSSGSIGGRHAAAVADPRQREHTVLEMEPQEIEVRAPAYPPIGVRVGTSVRLRLRGTYVHRPGHAWPLQPWKQAGAVSPAQLSLRRTGGWWRAGRWAIDLESTWTPWAFPRVVS